MIDPAECQDSSPRVSPGHPRMDETIFKYLCFEMKKGEVERKEMMSKLKERARETASAYSESRGI